MDIDIESDILQWVRDTDGVMAVLDNPINKRLMETGWGYKILDEKNKTMRSLSGFTKPALETFWPQEQTRNIESIKRAKAVKDQYKKNNNKTNTPLFGGVGKPKNKVVVTGQDAIKGMDLGRLIHRQIEDMVLMNAASFHRKYPQGAHPWATQVLNAITMTFGWKFVKSELIVANEDLGMATQIDITCVDQDGVLHFLELKTGYDTREEWQVEHGWMHSTLHGILKNSGQNRAIVQSIASADMAVKGHQLACRFACWVVHVNDTGTEFIPIDRDLVLTLSPLIREGLAENRSQVREQRRATRAAKKKQQPNTQKNKKTQPKIIKIDLVNPRSKKQSQARNYKR
jgi:hypothetical protein